MRRGTAGPALAGWHTDRAHAPVCNQPGLPGGDDGGELPDGRCGAGRTTAVYDRVQYLERDTDPACPGEFIGHATFQHRAEDQGSATAGEGLDLSHYPTIRLYMLKTNQTMPAISGKD